MQTFPERTRLRELRKELGLTQQELAKKVGAHKPMVSQWESGARRPSYNKMLALKAVLGPEVMDIFEAEAAHNDKGAA